jgi:hypothetical protein
LENISEPIVLQEMYEVKSESTNIERLFKMQAVFPDNVNNDQAGGGCSTRQGFKEVTLERMIGESDY